MKKVKIENTPPVKATRAGWWTTVQMVDDIIVLNVFENKILQARHCINVRTKECATYKRGEWSGRNVEYAYETKFLYGYDREEGKKFRMSKEDEKLIETHVKIDEYYYAKNAVQRIAQAELEAGREKRDLREGQRVQRVNAMMARIPKLPEDIREWIDRMELGGEDYCLKDRETGKWWCSSCGKSFAEKKIRSVGGGGWKDKDMVFCPECGETIRVKKRKKGIFTDPHFCMIQPIDDEISVARHFVAYIKCEPQKRKIVVIVEEIRIILFKGNNRRGDCDIYYRQPGFFPIVDGVCDIGCFDNRSNPANRRERVGYLYDGGIAEALRGTAYEPWAGLFAQLGGAGVKADYNRFMVAHKNKNYIRLIEMLFRGRFFRLVAEESENVWIWDGEEYGGELKLHGNSIEDVFDIGDRQKINRIRDKNGGNLMVQWMRHIEKHPQKLTDRALGWLEKNGIRPHELTGAGYSEMTVEQIMNYIERQRKESYKGKSVRNVVQQYGDYMAMCEKLGKDTRDELVYRPRELKRRHDEAVAQIERMNAQLKADEYSARFGEAEKVLGAIREKFEYEGAEYLIRVPGRIVDIVAEGNYLHHCAGATDRYFDRIKQHETYIVFLRKRSDPEIPFYTVEVEPGGTIRQHRGMYDEEPELESVKPFLREWQQEIRRRMSRKDHELAAVSAKKREENIAELREKRNTRVLNGLMEDLMEVV